MRARRARRLTPGVRHAGRGARRRRIFKPDVTSSSAKWLRDRVYKNTYKEKYKEAYKNAYKILYQPVSIICGAC